MEKMQLEFNQRKVLIKTNNPTKCFDNGHVCEVTFAKETCALISFHVQSYAIRQLYERVLVRIRYSNLFSVKRACAM